MIEEQAEVISSGEGFALVKPLGRSSCQHCSSKSGCGLGVFDLFRPKARPGIEVRNPLQAKPGDRVTLGIPTRVFLIYIVLAYLLPLLLLAMGALLGGTFGGSEYASILGGISGLVGGFVINRRLTSSDLSRNHLPIVILGIEPPTEMPLRFSTSAGQLNQ